MPDSVQLYSSHIKALRANGEDVFITRKEGDKREKLINQMVGVLRDPDLDEEDKKKALSTLWNHTCFYVIRQLEKSHLPKHLFEDALQNTYIMLAAKAHKYNPDFNPDFKTSFVGFLARCRTISNATQDALSAGQVVKDTKSVRDKLMDDIDQMEGVHTTLATTEYEDYMGEGIGYLDTGSSMSSSTAERGAYNRELKKMFEDIFSGNELFSHFEKTAVLGKFGLLGHQQLTLKELQANFASQGKEITMARISQIQSVAIEKLKHYLTKKGVDASLIL